MRKKEPNGPIDVVIPWVDGTDPEWNELLQQYSAKVEDISQSSTSITRFESWDNLKYALSRRIPQMAAKLRRSTKERALSASGITRT